MSEQIIISIGRQCGSGGHEIGEKLAAHYGIPLYDRNLIERLTADLDSEAAKLARMEEKVTGQFAPFLRKNGFSARERAIGDKLTQSDRLFLMERGLIRKMAEEESFVIIGRAANSILDGNPNALRLYLYAPESFKLPRVKEQYDLHSDAEAKKYMEKIDRERKAYFEYYTNMVWGSSDGHDFMMDTSILGIDGTAELIMELARKKLGGERFASKQVA